MTLKTRKHRLIAAGGAVTMLVAGVGVGGATLGVWHDTATSTVNSTVTAGKLRLKEVTSGGNKSGWFDSTTASGRPIDTTKPITIADFRMSPNDVIYYSGAYAIDMVGDKLVGKLETTGITATGALLGDSAANPLAGVQLSYQIFKANAAGTAPVGQAISHGDLTFTPGATAAENTFSTGADPVTLATGLTPADVGAFDNTKANYYVLVRASFASTTDGLNRQEATFNLSNMGLKLTQTL